MIETPELKNIRPIGVIHTPFREKFGVPRQSLMIDEARGIIKLNHDPDFLLALKHLDGFSNLWVIFLFHAHLEKSWRPTIRPPREGAPRKVGVFASRSPHRPNPIGISAVKLERINREAEDGIEIEISGVDFLDGTPVLDLKPYLPYADSIPNATSGWAEGEIPKYPVVFDEEPLRIAQAQSKNFPRYVELVTQILEWDPRPTSQRIGFPVSDSRFNGMPFGLRIMDYDVQWIIDDGKIRVKRLIK